MNRIPLEHRGKRPRFFAAHGVDELTSAILELTSEVSVLRQRMYALERVAADAGLDLRTRIEAYQPTADEREEMAASCRQLVAGVLRALEGEFADRSRVQQDVDAMADDAAAAAAVATTKAA